VVDGVLQLENAATVLTNPNALVAFGHLLGGALVTGGFVMAGVSAYHLRRGTTDPEFFRRSVRIGVATTLPALLVTVALGGLQFGVVADSQPLKIAAFGGDAAELARLQAEAVAQYGPGDYSISGISPAAGFVMIGCFALMLILAIAGVVAVRSRRSVIASRRWHLLMTIAIPLPFIAAVAGWVFRETGRQPWVVYGLLRTKDAVSDLSPGAMRLSLTLFAVLFTVLAAVNYWLLVRYARRSPDAVDLGRAPGEQKILPPAVPTF
jgi:cytochrome d ubiquinol oxidase subunit I